jgi:hypothetical protein
MPSVLRGQLTANPLTAANTGFRNLAKASSRSFSQPVRCLSNVKFEVRTWPDPSLQGYTNASAVVSRASSFRSAPAVLRVSIWIDQRLRAKPHTTEGTRTRYNSHEYRWTTVELTQSPSKLIYQRLGQRISFSGSVQLQDGDSSFFDRDNQTRRFGDMRVHACCFSIFDREASTILSNGRGSDNRLLLWKIRLDCAMINPLQAAEATDSLDIYVAEEFRRQFAKLIVPYAKSLPAISRSVELTY